MNVQVIGNKILYASDLEAMNKSEVKSRNYTHCTIRDLVTGKTYLAWVEYSEVSEAWEPTDVYVGSHRLPFGYFEEAICENYECIDYRGYPGNSVEGQ